MTETETGCGIVGAGRLAAAIIGRLSQAGDPPGLLFSTHAERAEALGRRWGWRAVPLAELARDCRLVLICVPDSQVARVGAELAKLGPGQGRVAVHCAGSLGPEALAPMRASGWAVGSFHPLAPVPDGDPGSLEGTWICLEADPDARPALRRLARLLRCQVAEPQVADRDLYHAGAVFAAVMPVLLEQIGEQLVRRAALGADLGPALRALYRASGGNVERLGPDAGISGPARRRDHETIGRDLAALGRADPRLVDLFHAIEHLAAALAPSRREPEEDIA